MRVLVAAVAALAIGSAATAAPSPALQPIAVQPLPNGAKPRPVALTRTGTTLNPGQAVGRYLYGVVCVNPETIAWSDVAGGMSGLQNIFGEELKAAGFKPDKEPGSLFSDTDGAASDLQVGAMVKGASVTVCDAMTVSSKMSLDVEWQIYSTFRREVIARVETHEGIQRAGGLHPPKEKRTLGQEAFAQNVRGLLANPEFRQIVTSPDPNVAAGPVGGDRAIQLASVQRGPVKTGDATGSVVAVFAGAGFGSGVLVSADGYILTNQHVVGAASNVRVRWSDGFETTGEVVRSDKRRDVALVKADPHGRLPLAVRRELPAVGSPVYAIGTPLDPKLQSTVTRGVVSATRIVDGFMFIQSDTPVTHGNSGGPLLNERGEILGLTDWGVEATQGSSLNFFIPIGDALDFLSLKPAA